MRGASNDAQESTIFGPMESVGDHLLLRLDLASDNVTW
jgi:hypothetical protein